MGEPTHPPARRPPRCHSDPAQSPLRAVPDAVISSTPALTLQDIPGTCYAPLIARDIVATVLGEHPCLPDAQLVVSELVTNAVRHTRSGWRDGLVGLAIDHRDGRVRIEVIDNGPLPGQETRPELSTDATRDESGHGLWIVRSCAHRWGVIPHPLNDYCTVWAELTPGGGNAA